MLVIDRTNYSRFGVSRIPITDPDPEKLCAFMKRTASLLRPPGALWYVEPAKPFRGGPKRYYRD